ncbi:hypothetical protein BC833DRAFT_356705 [Globomyces pollinis-pini]|nr:hypothetical protein BC833DRAFT_356705 [Globomyces pollinis-pini]
MPIISKNGPLKVDAAIPNNDKQLKIPKESTILKMFNDGSSSSSSSSASVSMAKEKTVAEPTIADLELLMLDSISKLTAKITDESLIDSINGLKTKMEKLKEKYTELDKLECEMIKCAICLDPFSKPHIIECGHTFCYECLESWSKRPEGEGNGQCPTCRKHLVQKPILNLGMEQHVEFVVAKRHDTEAAKRIASANSGYKKLFFEDWKMPISVIRDEEDGVLRCGVCGWEIIDRNCARCSQQYAHISNSDHSDDSNERSSDEESLDSSEAGFIVSDDYLSAEERY